MNINNINNINISPKGLDICHENLIQQANTVSDAKNISFGADYTKAKDFLTYVSKNFSSPHQRATLGITALCTQPFIDLHNKHIKEEDRSVVVAKTIAKVVIGTTVGVCMRHFSIKAVQNYTKSVNTGKYSQILLPKTIIEKIKTESAEKIESQLDNYRKGLGTFIGVMGCLFTNFAVDAPLTKIMTNFINDKVFNKEKANGK